MSARVIASILGSAATFIAGIAMPVAFPQASPWIGQIGLAFSAVLAIMAVVFLLWDRKQPNPLPDRHREVLQSLAAPLAQLQEQVMAYGPRNHAAIAEAKAQAEALNGQIPYDEDTFRTVRDFIHFCEMLAHDGTMHWDERPGRDIVHRASIGLFRYLHEGRPVDRAKIDLPSWARGHFGDEESGDPRDEQVRQPPKLASVIPAAAHVRPQIRAERLIESANGAGEKTLWLEISNPNEQEATGLVARLVDAAPPLMEAGSKGLGLPRVLATKGRLDRLRTGTESPIRPRPFNLAPHDKKQIEIFRAPRFNGLVATITGEAGETEFILHDQELTVEVVGGGNPARVVIPVKLDPTNGTWSATLIIEAAGEAHGKGGIGRRS
jgi:hypothetical protein